MLRLVLGTDWTVNTNTILTRISSDVQNELPGRILIVPEQISHDSERKLAEYAGNTASRFAEVLSFTRLVGRVAEYLGRSISGCLDNGGRVVAMAAAVQQVNSRLKAYASVGTKPEFLVSLIDAVDEFKRCCISSDDLMSASGSAEGSLAQKLEELSFILESYDSICGQAKLDPRDQMMLLLDGLVESDYAQNHVFYVDGFPDFTRQNLAVLEHLICNSPFVTVSLHCDEPDSKNLAFEKAGETAADILRIARKHNIPVEIEQIPAPVKPTTDICTKLFQGMTVGENPVLNLYRTETVHQECEELVERIHACVTKGARYRDIGILCGDIGTYKNILHSIFERCGIPLYLSGTDDILEKTVISTVLSAIDTALNGFEQSDVIRYLKTTLSPLDDESCDLLENYAIIWGISGRKWLQPWTYHPDGLVDEWSEDAVKTLEKINDARTAAIEPLAKLQETFRTSLNLADQLEGLYAFFEEIALPEKLQNLADEFEADGDSRSAQILTQLWEILLGAMEQMHDVLGKYIWEPEYFTRLFKLLLSQYSVGTIPPKLDTVTVGSSGAMRFQQVKHLFVLGAKEGALPKYGSNVGILTDQERTQLRILGLPLTGGALDGLKIEFSEIYAVFCGAKETVTVSCPAGQTSFVYQRLQAMAKDETATAGGLGTALINPTDAAAYCVRFNAPEVAIKLGLEQEYKDVIEKHEYNVGCLDDRQVSDLYGSTLYLSASQVDKQANCRFSYFLHYGLRLKERKQIMIDPAEFGSYVHDVLENTVAEVMELGGFTVVTEAQMQEIASKYSEQYAKRHFHELDSDRLNYLFNRNSKELRMIISDLWDELQMSEFLPKFFELSFNDRGAMPPISIDGERIRAKLGGFVDRVDVWTSEGRTYFRVVDYKTGIKSFDYCDIINGIGLQMLLYLFALEDNGAALVGKNAIPAGVQYVPARAEMISQNGLMDAETVLKDRRAAQKRKGLLLADPDVLQAMEPLDKPVRLSYTKSKDGELGGDIAGSEQFSQLKSYVFRILHDMVDDISRGMIKPNPYYRDERTNACRFCPFGTICRRYDVEDYRYFKALNRDEFWQDVRKELEGNG